MSNQEAPMDYKTRERCWKLRVRSKRGEMLPFEDVAFLEACFKTYPQEYSAMSDGVFKESAPFGART